MLEVSRTPLKTKTKLTAQIVKQVARETGGFELAGIARAEPIPEGEFYLDWVSRGLAGKMTYLTDERALKRLDPRSLLPSAKSILCVGKLYNVNLPSSQELADPGRGWIARYAWGVDYHRVIRQRLQKVVDRLQEISVEPFEYKICVDTAPLLERAYARRAGLGWIGRNSCLINEPMGSWFLLGEVLLSLELEPDSPPPDRCGTCRRCVEACPTQAIVPTGRAGGPEFTVDSRRCISYLTIELRGEIPEELRSGMGNHIFGCDICQEVCPWNRRAPQTQDLDFWPRIFAPRLDWLLGLRRGNFRRIFGPAAVSRIRLTELLRNALVAAANAGCRSLRDKVRQLQQSSNRVVAEQAEWTLTRLQQGDSELELVEARRG